jgi:hypothetical protein
MNQRDSGLLRAAGWFAEGTDRLTRCSGPLLAAWAVIRSGRRWRVGTEIASMEERLGQRISSLEVRTARETVIQTRWMIGLWAAQITAFIGTIFIVLLR